MPRFNISFDAADFFVSTTSEILYLNATLRLGAITLKGNLPMAITISVTQQFTVSVTAVDARGNPAVLDGPPTWAVSDTGLLTVQAQPDGSAIVKAVAMMGNAQVTVSADADIGDGVRNLTGVLDVTIVAGEAVALAITTGVPTEQAVT